MVWIDLLDPESSEERAIEALLGIQIPSRGKMREVADSARLYQDGQALVMTAVVVADTTGRPARAEVTFVLTPTHLVSVRYADTVPFRAFEAKCMRDPERHKSSGHIFVSILESIAERVADKMEAVAAELNDVSTTLFFKNGGSDMSRCSGDELQALIMRLGRVNLTVAILRESLFSLGRLLPFARAGAAGRFEDGDVPSLEHVDRDLSSLTAYEAQISSEIDYLHDATLGLLTVDQNRIIKVFSIAAVLFLPPTLVGTVYGMNFERMPELNWTFGYPLALFLMALSAILPFLWLKRRGWL